MALIYIDPNQELDLLQLTEEVGDGVNVGSTVDGRRFVSADVDAEILAVKVKAHVPNKEAIAAREQRLEADRQAAEERRRRAETARDAARASATAKLRKLGLTDAEIEALRS